MSYKEYTEELYNAVDKIRGTFWLDDVADEVEIVMWYAGMSKTFKDAKIDEWDYLLKQAQEVLNLDMGR